jgi:hypothetical protein
MGFFRKENKEKISLDEATDKELIDKLEEGCLPIHEGNAIVLILLKRILKRDIDGTIQP